MSLSDEEKRDMLEDGLSRDRREAFRVGRLAQPPRTFDDYIAALDDLQLLAPAPPRPPFIIYRDVQL